MEEAEPEVFVWIEARVAGGSDVIAGHGVAYAPDMSGEEYEHFVASVLENLGWDVHVQGGSGDHGLDVLARRDGRTLVVQCKHWQGAVGNDAVQAVLAARALMSADLAAVVAPNGFTSKAVELASATGVLLVHHTDLALVGEDREG